MELFLIATVSIIWLLLWFAWRRSKPPLQVDDLVAIRRSPTPRLGRHISERDDLGHQRRALEYGVPFENISLMYVFNRDEWTCGICHGPIDPHSRYPDPMMPSLDHVVPLSRRFSPGHVLDNVQASHLRCNLRKGVR